jgi:peptidoglycan hydrolase-like protein with peptidoglycan-binding domain
MHMTTPVFSRVLQLQLPYDRGLDVLALQNRLVQAGIRTGGAPDGVFGPMTATAMRAWQAKQGLPTTGICDAGCWKLLFPDAPDPATRLTQLVAQMAQDHAAFPADGAYTWKLDATGLHIDNKAARGSGGPPVTVRNIWEQFGTAISTWSTRLSVPAELIVATIGTESSGDPKALRHEPRYKSDEETPDQVSPGLMQTLLSTARSVLANPTIDSNWLLVPEHSIQAGTAYILQQSRHSGFDPPLVACCYNAGRIALQESPSNLWRMLQYPVGTGNHCDRFVQWFNDAMTVFAELPEPPQVSFVRMLGTQPVRQAQAA